MPAPSERTNKTADRTLHLLRLVAESGVTRFADLEARTGLPKATLHELLGSLLGGQWVTRDDASGRFEVGPACFEVGAAFAGLMSTRRVVGAVLDDLVARFDETCNLGLLQGADILYLDRRVTGQPMAYAPPVGRRLPAHSTALGKILLAELGSAELDARLPSPLPKVTRHTITSRRRLATELSAARAHGFAADSQESTLGVGCIAVRVPHDRLPLALSMAAPVLRLGPDALSARVPELRSAARDIGLRLAATEWATGTTVAEGIAAAPNA